MTAISAVVATVTLASGTTFLQRNAHEIRSVSHHTALYEVGPDGCEPFRRAQLSHPEHFTPPLCAPFASPAARTEAVAFVQHDAAGAFRWRGGTGPLTTPIQLVEAHLEDTELTQIDFDGVNLTGAHLDRADLSEAHLYAANLPGASLRAADLRNADLAASNLRGAHLEGANLDGAILQETYLTGATADSDTIWPRACDWRSAGVLCASCTEDLETGRQRP